MEGGGRGVGGRGGGADCLTGYSQITDRLRPKNKKNKKTKKSDNCLTYAWKRTDAKRYHEPFQQEPNYSRLTAVFSRCLV